MAINNSTIETNKNKEYFVLLVRRGNIEKYIGNKWFSKKHINCTVLIDNAKRFDKMEQALKFYDNIKDLDSEVSLVKPVKLNVQYSISI